MVTPVHIKPEDSSSRDRNLHITVTGFKQQSQVSVEAILTAIDKLPNKHLKNITAILFEPKMYGPLGLYAYDQHDTAGYSYKRNHRILIHRINDLPTFIHTLYHEIGHHVFYEVISQAAKKQWVTTLHPHSTYVSAYAKRNAAEDFAETYTAYLLENEKLKNHPSKYQFMKSTVFI